MIKVVIDSICKCEEKIHADGSEFPRYLHTIILQGRVCERLR